MKKQINLDSKIISGVEEHRLGLIRELEGLQSAIDGNLLKSVDFDVGKGVPLGG